MRGCGSSDVLERWLGNRLMRMLRMAKVSTRVSDGVSGCKNGRVSIEEKKHQRKQ